VWVVVSAEMLREQGRWQTRINMWAAAQGSDLNIKLELSIKTCNVNIAQTSDVRLRGTLPNKKEIKGHDKNRAASNPSGSYIGSSLICLKMKSLQYLSRIRSKKPLYVPSTSDSKASRAPPQPSLSETDPSLMDIHCQTDVFHNITIGALLPDIKMIKIFIYWSIYKSANSVCCWEE